jgi:hypothetical protein
MPRTPNLPKQGKLLVAGGRPVTVERVRAYFDEPEIGRLAVGQKIRSSGMPSRAWSGRDTLFAFPLSVITYGTRNVGEVLVGNRRCRRRIAAGHQRQRHGNHREAKKML